jgi:hypothetical protein
MQIDSKKTGSEDLPPKPQAAAWQTHQWSCRRLELEPGKPLVHYKCAKCHRDIVDDLTSDERYAVHVSPLRFNRLANEVCDRWLEEPCPAVAQPSDDLDRTTYVGRTSRNIARGKATRRSLIHGI